MAIFWLVFSAQNPVKSYKLALIEGRILNLMFLDINIPVVPIEICLRVTHNQRQKTPKVASVLLFRHILKTKSWQFRMWPGILRDGRQRNVQKSVMHVQSCCFANQTYCFFAVLVAVAAVVVKAPYFSHAQIVILPNIPHTKSHNGSCPHLNNYFHFRCGHLSSLNLIKSF